MSLRQISLSYQTIEYTLRIRDFPPVSADSDTDWLICADRLRLADGRSLESYKRRVQRMREEVIAKHSKGSRRVPGAKKFLDAQAQQDFGNDWDTVRAVQKERLVQAYRDTKTVACDMERAKLLVECATQGHIQAAVDAANIYANSGFDLCVGYYVEAHNQGHPKALVQLATFFSQAARADLALKCMLLAAHCGDYKSGRVCLTLPKSYCERDVESIPWSVLKEASQYGCLYADFILAALYRYGHSSYRNIDKARQILVKAEAFRFSKTHSSASQKLHNIMLACVERELFELNITDAQAQMDKYFADKKAPGEACSCDDLEYSLSILPAFPRRFIGRVEAWLNDRGTGKGSDG